MAWQPRGLFSFLLYSLFDCVQIHSLGTQQESVHLVQRGTELCLSLRSSGSSAGI